LAGELNRVSLSNRDIAAYHARRTGVALIGKLEFNDRRSSVEDSFTSPTIDEEKPAGLSPAGSVRGPARKEVRGSPPKRR
jgi:hypothetical protein